MTIPKKRFDELTLKTKEVLLLDDLILLDSEDTVIPEGEEYEVPKLKKVKTNYLPFIRYAGEWSGTTIYKKNELVYWYEVLYLSLQDTNEANNPELSSSSAYWTRIETNTVRGAYSGSKYYKVSDIVIDSTGIWQSLQNDNQGQPLIEGAFWTLIFSGSGGTSEAMVWKGIWDGMAIYQKYEVVNYNNNFFICKFDGTGGGAIPGLSGNWSLLKADIKWKGVWSEFGEYSEGSLVLHNSNLYLATTTNGGSYTAPYNPELLISSEYWVRLSTNVFRGEWDSSYYYKMNDLIIYNNTIWKSLISDNFNNIPNEGSAAWTSVLASSGGGTPGGEAGSIQFNGGGSFDGFGSYNPKKTRLRKSGLTFALSWDSDFALDKNGTPTDGQINLGSGNLIKKNAIVCGKNNLVLQDRSILVDSDDNIRGNTSIGGANCEVGIFAKAEGVGSIAANMLYLDFLLEDPLSEGFTGKVYLEGDVRNRLTEGVKEIFNSSEGLYTSVYLIKSTGHGITDLLSGWFYIEGQSVNGTVYGTNYSSTYLDIDLDHFIFIADPFSSTILTPPDPDKVSLIETSGGNFGNEGVDIIIQFRETPMSDITYEIFFDFNNTSYNLDDFRIPVVKKYEDMGPTYLNVQNIIDPADGTLRVVLDAYTEIEDLREFAVVFYRLLHTKIYINDGPMHKGYTLEITNLPKYGEDDIELGYDTTYFNFVSSDSIFERLRERFLGKWVGGVLYNSEEIVYYTNGTTKSYFKSKISENIGNEPFEGSEFWDLWELPKPINVAPLANYPFDFSDPNLIERLILDSYANGISSKATAPITKAIGNFCHAEKANSWAEGTSAKTKNIGSKAWAAGVFNESGDCQLERLLVRGTTDNSVGYLLSEHPFSIFSPGLPGFMIEIPSGMNAKIYGHALATTDDNTVVGSFKFSGLVVSQTGIASLIGKTIECDFATGEYGDDFLDSDFNIQIGIDAGKYYLEVIGDGTGKSPLKWNAVVYMLEITN